MDSVLLIVILMALYVIMQALRGISQNKQEEEDNEEV